ncbi:HlyD family type I secretion periplasmic adaptor subunit [Novosphingobium sp.]|uniref:HlyD family type I secretion periplasmic adaptor subunit n=1 Tax=Novosphingobium sp. TaxID=1874826 RepID=UPI0031CDD0CE
MPARLHLVQAARDAFPGADNASNDTLELPELLMPLGASDAHSGRILHGTLIALSAAVVVAIGWAAMAQVSDVSQAVGTLEPDAHERRIEHVDGGQISRLLVHEGDKVVAGQPLMELDGAQAAGDVAYAKERLAMIDKQLSTVKALENKGLVVRGDSAEAQRAAFLGAENRAAAARAQQQAASIALIRAQLTTAESAAKIARDDRDRAQRLFSAEAVTRSSLNQREQQLNDADGRVNALRQQLSVASGGFEQATSEAASVRSRQQVDLYQEGNTLALQGIEANVLLKRAMARTDRLIVRSPVAGMVKSLTIAPGSVVAPGGLLAVVVPSNEKLMIDSQIPATNIHDVRAGLDAHVRINGFDLPGKGWIDGQVHSISPSSFADDRGNRFYKVRIAITDKDLDRRTMASLAPGLEAHADIITGHKSVLSFLVSPVRHGLDAALTEK